MTDTTNAPTFMESLETLCNKGDNNALYDLIDKHVFKNQALTTVKQLEMLIHYIYDHKTRVNLPKVLTVFTQFIPKHLKPTIMHALYGIFQKACLDGDQLMAITIDSMFDMKAYTHQVSKDAEFIRNIKNDTRYAFEKLCNRSCDSTTNYTEQIVKCINQFGVEKLVSAYDIKIRFKQAISCNYLDIVRPLYEHVPDRAYIGADEAYADAIKLDATQRNSCHQYIIDNKNKGAWQISNIMPDIIPGSSNGFIDNTCPCTTATTTPNECPCAASATATATASATPNECPCAAAEHD